MKKWGKHLGLSNDDKTLLRTQNHIYADYFNRLRNLCITRFKWENLPDGVDQRYLEWILFYNGKCVFYYDEYLERYLVLECTLGGEMGFYNIPKEVSAYSTNARYTLRTMPTEKTALIFNNYSWLPDAPTADLFATKLTRIEMNLLSNVELQKFPVLIRTPEKRRLTFFNLMQKFFGYEPFLLASDQLPTENIEVMNLNMPFVADKLQVQKMNVWKEAINTFGIVATSSEKTERLVSNEVVAGLGYSEIAQRVGLEPRRRACEQINKLYGLNVKVTFNSELYDDLFYPEMNMKKGDEVEDLRDGIGGDRFE